MSPVIRSVFLMSVLLIIFCGCSESTAPISPAVPDSAPPALTQQNTHEIAADNGTHNLWVYSQIYVDPEKMKFEIIPVRQVTAHWNVLTWLENGPCTNCFKLKHVEPSGYGTLLVDVEIRHPFSNPNFTGFDVRGIAMFTGSKLFPDCGLTAPDRTMGDGELVNADGYTALYNITTAGNGPKGLQGYLKGKYASITPPNALLNGYIRHISDDPANTRNAFYAGSAIIETYDIAMPAGPFIFGYAVDANWISPSVPIVTDPMTDFPPEANCPEPWKIEITESPIGAGLTESGGSTVLNIYVSDWQGKVTNLPPEIECPDLFDGIVHASWVEDQPGYSLYSAIVSNVKPAPVGEYKYLISVWDTANSTAPDWLDLSAYQIRTLLVSSFTAQNPIAQAACDPTEQNISTDVHFFDDGSYDPDGGLLTKYEWDWNNDGTYDEEGSDVHHSWSTPGTYQIQFRVTDNESATDVLDSPLSIFINNKPVANVLIGPNPQSVCKSIDFTDEGSYDPDGGSIVLYEWDWDNDGTYDEEGNDLSHTWYVPGSYQVQFRVTDDEGTTDELDSPLDIVINNLVPIADASASNLSPFLDENVIFDGSGSFDPDCGGDSIVAWDWDWNNDGIIDDSGETQLHYWSFPGDY
ncbi:MAG: PKD domain-containing protein, partial [bacterium]